MTETGQRDEEGLLPAMRALYSGDTALAADLLPPDRALTAAEAAAFGRRERLAELLDEDVSRAAELSPDGFTPLHLACFAGGPETAKLLIERGADLETPSRHATITGVRPLGTALFAGDRESARLLLEAGADPNAAGEGGFTALHGAATNGDVDFVRLLLEFGADAALPGPDGRTAEAIARDAGHPECAELLSDRRR
jgi:ankyrin repeat protein